MKRWRLSCVLGLLGPVTSAGSAVGACHELRRVGVGWPSIMDGGSGGGKRCLLDVCRFSICHDGSIREGESVKCDWGVCHEWKRVSEAVKVGVMSGRSRGSSVIRGRVRVSAMSGRSREGCLPKWTGYLS